MTSFNFIIVKSNKNTKYSFFFSTGKCVSIKRFTLNKIAFYFSRKSLSLLFSVIFLCSYLLLSKRLNAITHDAFDSHNINISMAL